LQSYRDAVAALERLSRETDPSRTWQMWAMTDQRVGDAHLALRQENEALASYQRAIVLLRKQLALESQSATRRKLQSGLTKMAFALNSFGYPEKAISFYDEALQLVTDDANIYRSRGTAAFHAGRFDLAIRDLSNAARLDPSDAYTVLWL